MPISDNHPSIRMHTNWERSPEEAISEDRAADAMRARSQRESLDKMTRGDLIECFGRTLDEARSLRKRVETLEGYIEEYEQEIREMMTPSINQHLRKEEIENLQQITEDLGNNIGTTIPIEYARYHYWHLKTRLDQMMKQFPPEPTPAPANDLEEQRGALRCALDLVSMLDELATSEPARQYTARLYNTLAQIDAAAAAAAEAPEEEDAPRSIAPRQDLTAALQEIRALARQNPKRTAQFEDLEPLAQRLIDCLTSGAL